MQEVIFMKKEKEAIESTPSSTPIMDDPLTAMEMVNKYGTYEIQPTADNDNKFPKIAQGLPKPQFRKKEDDNTGIS